MALVDHADNPRRLAPHADDADVRACAYPYATVLDGMRWRVQRARLSFPLHGVEDPSRPWRPCVPPASGGEAWPLYGTQVIQDLVGPCPSSLAHAPFRGNGSQLPPVDGSPALRVLWGDPTPHGPSAALLAVGEASLLPGIQGIRLRRDSWVSVMYPEELNSGKSSVTLQRTDRHGIVDQKLSNFQEPL